MSDANVQTHDNDPALRAIERERRFTSNGFILATITLFLLLAVILLIFAWSFTWAPYCPPGALCDTAFSWLPVAFT
jgi:uncharacterized membrane protein